MVSSFSEKAVADFGINIQKNMGDDEDEHADRENDEPDLGIMGDRMRRLVGDGRDELGRRARVALAAGLYLVLTKDRRSRVGVFYDIVRAVAIRARGSAGVTQFQFSAVEALEVALHDVRAQPVLFGHDFLFVAGTAGLYDVEVVYLGFFARLRLDVVRGTVAARAHRAVRGFLDHDVLAVDARLVFCVNVPVALYARRLGNRVHFALYGKRICQVLDRLVYSSRRRLVGVLGIFHVAVHAVEGPMNRFGKPVWIYIQVDLDSVSLFHRILHGAVTGKARRGIGRRIGCGENIQRQ